MQARAVSGLLGFLVVSGLTVGQVVYIGNPSPTSGAPNSIPFSLGAMSTTSLHVYTAAEIAAGGPCAGSVLTDLAVAAAAFGGGSGSYYSPTTRFLIGHLSMSPPIAGAWTTHLSSPVAVHEIVDGPYSFPWTGGTWTSLPGVAAAGFVWDGVRDIGVFYTQSTGLTSGLVIRTSPFHLRHSCPVFDATTQMPSIVGSYAMRVRLTFTSGTATYQTNQPAASFDIDGVVSLACAPATVSRCGGLTSTANLSSVNVGQGWELAYTSPEAPVSSLEGGIRLPASGQVFNIDLTASSLGFLNGLTLPPFPASAVVAPFTVTAPLSLGAQIVVISAGQPDGLALSQAVWLCGLVAMSVPGPTGDDAFVTVNLGPLPFCGPTTMGFFGTGFTQFSVTTNGRIMFGTPNWYFIPTLAGAQVDPGMVGPWCDLNQGPGGIVTIAGTPAGTIRVDYLGVPYFATSIIPNTFGIEYDPVLQTWRIDGLGGIALNPFPYQYMLIGMSRGAGATNPGQATFAPGSTGGSAMATDMLYRYGQAGALTPGVTSILFTPDGANNYVWSAY